MTRQAAEQNAMSSLEVTGVWARQVQMIVCAACMGQKLICGPMIQRSVLRDDFLAFEAPNSPALALSNFDISSSLWSISPRLRSLSALSLSQDSQLTDLLP